MKFNDYIEQVRNHVKEHLPKEFQEAEILIQEQRKNNDTHIFAMTMRSPGISMSPLIYLEDYYELHKNGMPLNDNIYLIGKKYLSAMNNIKFEQDFDMSYDNMKDKLFLNVVNADKYQNLLVTVHHQRIEDLAVLYRCMVHSSDNGMGTILVNNRILDTWGISEETLHEQAQQNMNNLFTPEFHTMEYVISELMEQPFTETEATLKASNMFVLTNDQRLYGASYLCNPDVLKEISEKLDGDFMILPSSVHEIIILRENQDMDISDLQEMVKSVNQTEVGPTDYLSDNVYHYNSLEQTLSISEGNGMQQRMMTLE